ncbi:MAG: hypothetical protein R3A51_18085 [Nannocystaceae bacterium]
MIPSPRWISADDPRVTAAQAGLSSFAAELFEFGVEAVLLFDGDTHVHGSLDPAWVELQAATAGAEGSLDFPLVLVRGDLRVDGDVVVIEDFFLLVTGDLECRNLIAGMHCWTSITGDARARHLVQLIYNDTQTAIDGTTYAKLLLIEDHATNATPSPDTVVLDAAHDLRSAFARVAHPAALIDGALDINALVEHVRSGGDPLRVDVQAIYAALRELAASPVEAVERLVALDAADFVQYRGAQQGLTPLHWLGAFAGSWPEALDAGELVRRLVEAGADVEFTVRPSGGPTRAPPLHHAALCGALAVARALQQAGAALDRPAADGETIDAQLLASVVRVHHTDDVDLDAAEAIHTRCLDVLEALGYRNIVELRRVVAGHLAAARAGLPDPTDTLRYRPLGWNEHAWWSERLHAWHVQKGDIPLEARFRPEENEWVVEDEGADGYALCRRYYRPSNGTLCCVAQVPDARRPQRFDLIRYHDNGEVSMTATWHEGHWHGEKVDYPCRAPTSEHFVIFRPPPNMAKAVSRYEEGALVACTFYDHDGEVIDKAGRRARPS